MNRDQILALIRTFARSQGCWGRLLRDLYILEENDPETFDSLMTEWEGMNFQSDLDCLLFLEGN